MPDLIMDVEVIGCPTVCLHCWAVGRPYQAMAMEDITWVLHEVRQFCTTHQLTFAGYPMHEVVAHPQAAQVLLLSQQLWDVAFSPLPTTGVPLATRSDWREILDVLRSSEVPMLWFAFHGTSEIHTGCNLFLTTENVSHFDQLVADLLQAGMGSIALGTGGTAVLTWKSIAGWPANIASATAICGPMAQTKCSAVP